MKKVISFFLVIFCFVGLAYSHEKPVNNDVSTVVHETWRVKFNCDKACDNASNCGLQLNTEVSESFELDCTCNDCQVVSQVSLGSNTEDIVNQAKNSLLKEVVWKMLHIEIKQKYADQDFSVSAIDVALNHGQVIVFFNCSLLADKKEVTIQVTDLFK
jgi:hypothetical protein